MTSFLGRRGIGGVVFFRKRKLRFVVDTVPLKGTVVSSRLEVEILRGDVNLIIDYLLEDLKVASSYMYTPKQTILSRN